MSKDTSNEDNTFENLSNEENTFEDLLDQWVIETFSSSDFVGTTHNQDLIQKDQDNIRAAINGGTSLKLNIPHTMFLPLPIWEGLTHLIKLDISNLAIDAYQARVGFPETYQARVGVKLPDAIWNLRDLEDLDLKGNKLTNLSSNIRNLTSLKRLNLLSTSLEEVPEGLWDLTKLEYLNLGINNITEISSDIKKLTSLRELSLIKNKIESIPEEIGDLVKMECLYLNDLSITSIPISIGNLTSLKRMDLSHNRIKEIPDEMSNLVSLERLELTSNQIEEIPGAIGSLVKLKYLGFGQNNITKIPSDIRSCISLEILELFSNRIEEIPDEMSNLVSLERLELTSNQIEEIPGAIGSLVKLKHLGFGKNNITKIPSDIRSCISLEILELFSNRIEEIPDEMSNLVSLERLELTSNQIEEIPGAIGSLVKLKYLSLGRNNITNIPSNIGGLTSLEGLKLHINQIEEIPDEMWNLINLEELDLSRNSIRTISGNITNLTSLKKLDIGANEVTTVVGLDSLPEDCEVYAEHNRISNEERERLYGVADSRGMHIAIYDEGEETDSDDVNVEDDEEHEDLKAEIIGKIVVKAPLSKREDLQTFLESDDVKQFQLFLINCPRTEGWKTQEDNMVQCLYEIADKMSRNTAVKAQCESLAETGIGTCGDRLSLAFVRMQLSVNSPDKDFGEMSAKEFYEHAKRDCAIKFLSEKADTKIEEMKKVNFEPDEIEVYLGYLRADLGLKLEANGMLYPRCSNVSDQELEDVKAEFQLHCDQLMSHHIYEDAALRAYCTVERIITTVGGRPEFSSEQLDGENDADYIDRVGELSGLVTKEIIAEIQNELVKWEKGENSTTEEIFFGINEYLFDLDEEDELFSYGQDSSSSSSDLRLETPPEPRTEPQQTRKRDLEPDTETQTVSSSSLKEGPDNKRHK